MNSDQMTREQIQEQNRLLKEIGIAAQPLELDSISSVARVAGFISGFALADQTIPLLQDLLHIARAAVEKAKAAYRGERK